MSPEYEGSKKEIINPSTSDFKIKEFVLAPIAKRNRMVEERTLPDRPTTLTDILPILGVYARQTAFYNRMEIDKKNEQILGGKEEEEETQGYSYLLSFEGAGGRGKNIMEELVHEYIDRIIQDFSRKGLIHWDDLNVIDEPTDSTVFWHNWEEIRNFMFVRGFFDDLKSIYTPFSEKDLNLITEKYGEDLANRLWEGGIFLLAKPAGTYGYAKSSMYYRFAGHVRRYSHEIRIVERAFGPGTFRDLTRLRSPFHLLKPDKIMYAANIAMTASPLVIQILDRYRAALQFTGEDLDAANEVQYAFGRPLFKSREELHLIQQTEKIKDEMNWYEQAIRFEEMQEGSNMQQMDRTQKAVRRVVEEYWFNGYLSHLPQEYQKVLEQDILTDMLDNDKYVFRAASSVMQDEALEIADFITTSPSFHLLAEIIRTIVYEKASETIHKSTDLEIGEFYPKYEDRPLEPLMSIIINNAPDINKYKARASDIRRIFRKYKLAT